MQWRVKTGPMAFNVEYRLQALKCKQRPLNEAEQAKIGELRSMDDVLPRPTADAQLELLQRVTQPAGNEAPEEVNSEFKLS